MAAWYTKDKNIIFYKSNCTKNTIGQNKKSYKKIIDFFDQTKNSLILPIL